MDIRHFRNTGAAHVHLWNIPKSEQKMLWPTNHIKLATQTMFTLFFGGNTFAPQLRWKGVLVQDFLQDSYIKCFAHLARRLAHLDAVLGYEVMNEPHHGYIGREDLASYDVNRDLHLGFTPTNLQAFALGDGKPQEVDFYVQSFPWPTRKVGKKVLNREQEVVWLNKQCIWKQHGVWGYDEQNGQHVPVILKPEYFACDPDTGREVSFRQDFYLPFVKKYATALREATNDRKFILVEPVPNEDPFHVETMDDVDKLGLGSHLVYAPHWYDLQHVFTKTFSAFMSHNVQELLRGSRNFYRHTYFGKSGVKRNYHRQISDLVRRGRYNLNLHDGGPRRGVPVIVGECGIPMDTNNDSGNNSGDFSVHNFAMDAMFRAFEKVHVNGFTVWNYYPKNEVGPGDRWNGEDFSIYSQTLKQRLQDIVNSKAIHHQRESNSGPMLKRTNSSQWYMGGRALEATIRPWAYRVAGKLVAMNFNYMEQTYELDFDTPIMAAEPAQIERYALDRQTEIYVPEFHYLDEHDESGIPFVDIEISDGEYIFAHEHQVLMVWHDPHVVSHTIKIKRSNRAAKLKKRVPLSSVEPTRLRPRVFPSWIDRLLECLCLKA